MHFTQESHILYRFFAQNMIPEFKVAMCNRYTQWIHYRYSEMILLKTQSRALVVWVFSVDLRL